MQFNVLTDFRFPVVMTNGTIGKVNPVQALRQAHQIREIATSSPLDRFAVFRFLLALLYWCEGFPQTSNESDNDQSFPEDWFAKLDDNPQGFDLLGDGPRFYQFPQNNPSEKKPAGYLIHEIPTGNNQDHFRHVVDIDYGLCHTCCVFGLLRLPPFAVGGGISHKSPDIGKKIYYQSGINKKPPVYAYTVGQTLASTLRSSWYPVDHPGIALWEHHGKHYPKKNVPKKEGILTGLTHIPHAYWLLEPIDVGKCFQCGKRYANGIVPYIIRQQREDVLSWDLDWWEKGSNDPHVIVITDQKRKRWCTLQTCAPLRPARL